VLKSDIGLPVYRPDIVVPKPEHRSTLIVTHTFEKEDFLSQVRAKGRRHEVKLTAMLQAALLLAVYDMADPKSGSRECYRSSSVMDLRNGELMSPYGERNKYVNNAVVLHTFEVPCDLLKTEGNIEDFWKVATLLSDKWTLAKKQKDMATFTEATAKLFVESVNNKT
jgi:hypothetical protein